VQEEFVRELGEEREIHLLVEGIHCAACVWLIERTLGALNGVLSAQVNRAGTTGKSISPASSSASLPLVMPQSPSTRRAPRGL
jgi:copper chaperone CopZ